MKTSDARGYFVGSFSACGTIYIGTIPAALRKLLVIRVAMGFRIWPVRNTAAAIAYEFT
ncbi:hypothetical protein GKIL_0137 [Gloeobacter kilaueensis JS1]|uniref:Uncharacterized protein n=1 Tax=Gloeobacter kilaueensis (strain ATCC BAA-2537 / CCAP 1431/1 / ULC 316 / JS1) TaxID=1183438 RepID=U5QFL2_GLOK1|nr:hypothetical protein GKIL_0137 [Gloeobacter kilaueensis JS1]